LPGSLAEFSNEPIKVVPHIKIPTAATPISSELPAGTSPAGYEDDIQISTEDLTEKDCIELTQICVNIPSIFGNPHLERSEAQCTPFGRQLHRYCTKKGIDPSDWVFDEFGMVVTGLGLVGGMWADHKTHKAETRKAKPQTDRKDDITIPKKGILAEQLPEDQAEAMT
jgi:hypothetical protein